MNVTRQSYLSLTFLLIGLQPNLVIAETTLSAPKPKTEAELSLSQSIDALALRVKQLEARNVSPDHSPVPKAEQDAYSVGLMIAEYANRVTTDMKMVGITLDTAIIEKGILDGVAERPRIPLPTAQAIITQLETRMANNASKKERITQKTLNDIAKTQNTLAKGDGLIWVSKKAGKAGKAGKSMPPHIIVEGKLYQGALFDGPRVITLKNIDEMNDVIKKAAALIGDNGVVELYAMANKVDRGFSLPTNISPWDIVHFTFTADFSSGQ